MSEKRVPLVDRVKATALFEFGSWVCRKVPVIGRHIVGPNPTQWYLTTLHADELEGTWVTRDIKAAPINRTKWQRGVRLEGDFPETTGTLARRAVAFAVGEAVVAGVLPCDDQSEAIMRVGQEGMRVGMGMFNPNEKTFEPVPLASRQHNTLTNLQMRFPDTPLM